MAVAAGDLQTMLERRGMPISVRLDSLGGLDMPNRYDNLAWELGYDAYFDLLDRDDNPYEFGTTEFDDWEDGWDRADSDCDVD